MNRRYFPHVRSSLVALGIVAGLAMPAAATPFADIGRAARAPEASETNALQVHYRRPVRRYKCYNCGRHGYWNDGWRYRHYRPYRRSYPGLYFGLGVAPYAYYYAPRRYYRRGGNAAHVRWCYDHYRSYRAWDNTFQPYHGPRRQCRSPFG